MLSIAAGAVGTADPALACRRGHRRSSELRLKLLLLFERPQIDQQILRGLVAAVRILLQQLRDDPLELGRRLRGESCQRRRIVRQNRGGDGSRARRPGTAADRVTISYSRHADAEEIAARDRAFRHAPARATCRPRCRSIVSRLAQGRDRVSRPRRRRRRSCLARPKSITLASPRAVTMMLAGLMSRCRMPCAWASLKPSTIWTAIVRISREIERRPAESDVERLAVDVLHRDVVAAVGFADLVDGADVRMIEGRGGARLPEQPPLRAGDRPPYPAVGT